MMFKIQQYQESLSKYNSISDRESRVIKKEEELKQLKNAIYDKVMEKKLDLERVTSELDIKSQAL